MGNERIATFKDFSDLIARSWRDVPSYKDSGYLPEDAEWDDRAQLGHAAFCLYMDLSRGERFDILEDALLKGAALDEMGRVITRAQIETYDDGHVAEDEAFMNLAMGGIFRLVAL